MARKRRIVDAGPFTIDLRNLEYMERIRSTNEYGATTHGIRFVFYSGAYRDAIYGIYSKTADRWYEDLLAAFKNYHT